MTQPDEVVPEQRSDSAVEPAQEPSAQPELVRWIPFVPLLALGILIGVFIIYSEILR